MSKIRLPPIGFWSYARQDDELSQGKLTTLRSLLMFELQQQHGRDHIEIFQDATTIPHGAAWEQEIQGALGKTTFFIPIVTPNFIQSEWCCREVTLFLEREAELHRLYPDLPQRSRIFPIQFIDIEDVDPADPAVLEALQNLQWFDFRRFRHRSYESETVREAISELAGSMREVLKVKVEDPDVARERAREAEAAAALAQRQEEAKAARAREEEARKRREAAQAAAEAARQRAEQAAEAARQRAEEAAEAARLQAEEAAEAARLLAEEEEAAERARIEAEAAASMLTAGGRAAAERVRAESEAALERARVESEAADRAHAEKEAAAERARIESDALAARERELAQAAAEAAEASAGEGFTGSGVKPAWIAAGAGGVVIVAALVYFLSGPIAAPGAAEDNRTEVAGAGKGAETGEDDRAWLYGRWGVDGDCSTPMIISGGSGGLRVEYGDQPPAQAVRSATADRIVTDRATYARRGATISYTEMGAQTPMTFPLRECPE